MSFANGTNGRQTPVPKPEEAEASHDSISTEKGPLLQLHGPDHDHEHYHEAENGEPYSRPSSPFNRRRWIGRTVLGRTVKSVLLIVKVRSCCSVSAESPLCGLQVEKT